jgi:hypothetical protein
MEIVFIKAGMHVSSLDVALGTLFIRERTQFDSFYFDEQTSMYYGYAGGHNVWCAEHQVEKVADGAFYVALEKVRNQVRAYLTRHYADSVLDVETMSNLRQHIDSCHELEDLWMFCDSEFDFEEDDFAQLVFAALA